MTVKRFAKFIVAATCALASVALGQNAARADGVIWSIPAAAGKPYAQNGGSSGLDFTSWDFKDNYVLNKHATQTRFWSVPMMGLSTVILTGTSSGVDTAVNGYLASAYCDAGAKARLRIYDEAGNAFFFGTQVNCSGFISAGLSPAAVVFPAAKAHTANVEFELPPNAAAYGATAIATGSLFRFLAMAKFLSAWVPAGAVLASLATVVALRASTQRENGRVSAQVASLAASVSRLQQERLSEQAAERRPPREIATAPTPQAPAARAGEAGQDRGAGGASPQADSSAKAGRDRPASIEHKFEDERSGQGPGVAERQQRLEAAIRQSIAKIDADVHSAECRESACRVDATFDSGKTSNAFLELAFLRTDEAGNEVFEHGGVYVPVQEPVGERHRSVFYVLKKPTTN